MLILKPLKHEELSREIKVFKESTVVWSESNTFHFDSEVIVLCYVVVVVSHLAHCLHFIQESIIHLTSTRQLFLNFEKFISEKTIDFEIMEYVKKDIYLCRFLTQRKCNITAVGNRGCFKTNSQLVVVSLISLEGGGGNILGNRWI